MLLIVIAPTPSVIEMESYVGTLLSGYGLQDTFHVDVYSLGWYQRYGTIVYPLSYHKALDICANVASDLVSVYHFQIQFKTSDTIVSSP